MHNAVIKVKNRLLLFPKFEKMFETFIGVTIHFITFNIEQNSFIVSWTENKVIDEQVNLMKIKAFFFLNALFKEFKSLNEENIKLVMNFINLNIQNLEFIVSNKYDYIKHLGQDSAGYPDNNYESLIYQILYFLSKVLVKEPYFKETKSIFIQ